MRSSTLLVYFTLLGFSRTLGQNQPDTSAASADSGIYGFHPSFNPQLGYGIVLAFRGREGPKQIIYEFGIARTTRSRHEGALETFACMELDDVGDELFYGLSIGGRAKQLIDLGASLNFITNLSGAQSVSMRPFLGFLLIPPLGLYCEVTYDISLAHSNVDIGNHWLVGFRYILGILKQK